MSKFNLQISAVSTDTDCSYEGDHDLFLTSIDKYVTYYCVDAIDNHDRLIEENKRLRNMLKRLVSHDNCRKDVIHLMSEADSLLEELDGNK